MQVGRARLHRPSYDEDDAFLLSAAYHALQVQHEQPPAVGAVPLTMGRHAPPQDLIDQRFAPHVRVRMASQKPRMVSHAVYERETLVNAEFRLPSLDERPRPRSAGPAIRSSFSIRDTAFQPEHTGKIGPPLRTVAAGLAAPSAPCARAKQQHMLLVEQLMLLAPPSSLVTGQDAVQFFLDPAQQNSGCAGLFIYCNLHKLHPRVYNPYDLVVVAPEAAEPEHFIVSASGVSHFQPNEQGNTATALPVWLRELHQFKALKHMTFFSKYPMAKAWLGWKRKHWRDKYERRRRFLQDHHPLLNAWLGPPARALAAQVRPAQLLQPCSLHHCRCRDMRACIVWCIRNHQAREEVASSNMGMYVDARL